jgi:hypothetical protein
MISAIDKAAVGQNSTTCMIAAVGENTNSGIYNHSNKKRAMHLNA